jgi:acyl-CoA synthetase (AMP-forming)/AMP-acid ligase II
MRLTSPLHKSLRECPDAPGYADAELRLSHREFVDRVARLAAALRAHGVQPGDRVAMLAANSVRYVESLFASWWLGAVVAPVNTRWSAAEMAYGFEDCGAEVLIVDSRFAGSLDALGPVRAQLRTVIHAEKSPAPGGMLGYEDLLREHAPIADASEGGDQLAAILYTGGTTGRSKGVMLSHRALATNALATLASDARGPQPVLLHSAPMFHIGGIGLTLQGATRLARQFLLPAFEPKLALDTIERERISEIFLVPTMIKMLIEHPGFSSRDTSSLRTLIYGAAPISPTLLSQAMQALPQAGFIQVYGQTESGPILAQLDGWMHRPESGMDDKLPSAGRPVATAELRIVDHDGRDCAPGEVGQICARGPTLMSGYWNKPEQTAEALRDGWLYTGDGGYLDADGYLFVVDRFKDMIISGGENVFSTEVENALLQHAAVSQCAVIGVPDDKWGERVHAVVVLRDGHNADADTLIAHCKTLIAGYKCPRSIEFRDQLPTSAAGKLLKYQLREVHWKGRSRQVS